MTESISEIKARYTDSGFTADEYKKLAISEIAQIRLDIKRVLKKYDKLETRNATLREKLEAAVEDMKRMDAYIAESADPCAALCEVCRHKPGAGEECKRCDVYDNVGFEWRGGQEGEKE